MNIIGIFKHIIGVIPKAGIKIGKVRPGYIFADVHPGRQIEILFLARMILPFWLFAQDDNKTLELVMRRIIINLSLGRPGSGRKINFICFIVGMWYNDVCNKGWTLPHR